MEKRAVWTENCAVRFSDIDKSDSMTLNAALNFFQEAAISHAENLGVGRGDMARSNQVWILSRMSIQVDRRPKYGEIVTVRTWPRGWEKLFALRDFDMCKAGDIPDIRARSCWIIIDLEKRRPMRPHSIMDLLPQNDGMDALDAAAGLEKTLSLEKKCERSAWYNDVDYNGHVNNVSYIRWIEDALDPILLENARQMRLDINYMNELLPGDVTGIWLASIDAPSIDAPPIDALATCTPTGARHAFAIEGRKTQDNQTAFRAELRLW